MAAQVIAKPVGVRESYPQVFEKCGHSIQIPGKVGSFTTCAINTRHTDRQGFSSLAFRVPADFRFKFQLFHKSHKSIMIFKNSEKNTQKQKKNIAKYTLTEEREIAIQGR